jgi:hypothetical protein
MFHPPPFHKGVVLAITVRRAVPDEELCYLFLAALIGFFKIGIAFFFSCENGISELILGHLPIKPIFS